jgi:hypothetical protein
MLPSPDSIAKQCFGISPSHIMVHKLHELTVSFYNASSSNEMSTTVQVPPNHTVSVIGDDEMVMRKPLMELLMNLLESAPIEEKPDELVESETVGGLMAEGFAKVLLQSKAFKDVQRIEDILFAQLICLYFNGDMNNSPRFVSVTLHMLCK